VEDGCGIGALAGSARGRSTIHEKKIGK